MRPRQGQEVSSLLPGRGRRTAARLALFLYALSAHAQYQSARIATDFTGGVVLIESSAALRGGTSGLDHILAFDNGSPSTEAVGASSSIYAGVAYPFVNDIGSLRAFTLTRPPFCGFGGCGSPPYAGVVRNVRDGWEISYPGRAAISREGRWAAFSSIPLQRTTWVDLWTATETTVNDALDVSAMADDGTLVTPRGRILLASTPGRETRRFDLPFQAVSAVIGRSSTVAAVTTSTGIYRLDLSSGAIEDWAPTWDNAQLHGLSSNGQTLIFTQWNILYSLDLSGSPRRLSEEGQLVHAASLTGDDAAAIANTLSGIVRYPLDGQPPVLLIPGDTNFALPPSVLAPGLWLSMTGRGTANAQITLNGQPVDALARTPTQLTFAIPDETPTGPSQLEIQQPNSPFEPFRLTLPVQLAAPRFLIQRDLGEGNEYYADSPYILHAATGQPVSWTDPARPDESIDVLMTGLNHQGPAIQWSINRINQDDYLPLAFVSERPHDENLHWRWVRLRLPAVLPGPNCWLNAVFGDSAHSAYFTTATGL